MLFSFNHTSFFRMSCLFLVFLHFCRNIHNLCMPHESLWIVQHFAAEKIYSSYEFYLKFNVFTNLFPNCCIARFSNHNNWVQSFTDRFRLFSNIVQYYFLLSNNFQYFFDYRKFTLSSISWKSLVLSLRNCTKWKIKTKKINIVMTKKITFVDWWAKRNKKL